MLNSTKKRVAVALVAVSLFAFISISTTSAQRAACDRGNFLRGVVFDNTKAAIQENKGHHAGRYYRANLRKLVSPETVDDKTGLVNCEDQFKYFGIFE